MISKFGVLLIAAAFVCCHAQPPCVCTRELKPVCGSDGVTYPNECMLNCAKHNTKTDIEVASRGPCENEQPMCICTMEYTPVCGSDGNTYPNPCTAKCSKAEVVSYGECDTVKVAELPPCTCGKERKPVCGTDGNTYSNACLLNCATSANHRLGIANQGPCNEVEVTTLQTKEESCTCTRNLTPVCGSDGVTYNNECLLRCSGNTKTKDGACEEVNFVNN